MQGSQRPEKPPVKIVGPEADIQRVVNLAYSLLQVERFPELQFIFEVIPISPGESIDVSELHVDTCKTVHPVQGLCYKFTDKRTQSSFVYTGDTAYHLPIADHARGASLLIHEASHGPNTSSDRYAHSGSLEAAKIAQLANIHRLALIHCPESLIQKALDTARQIVPDTFLPEDGQIIEL
jgi:ribonuclease Z